TSGVYKAGLKDHSILSETFTMVVKAECSNVIKSLQVNDTYDIAAAYNLTAKDFGGCFNVSVETGNTLISQNQINEGIIVAVEEGKTVLKLTVKDKRLLSKLTGLNENQLPTFYTIELNIYKGFTLDRTSVAITVGGSLQLQAFYNSGIAESITWKSEDKNFVEVNQKGVITGVKETGGKEILVTASMQLSDGRILRASCRVIVTKTAEEIILSQKELRMQVGQTATLTATFLPPEITEIPGLKWLVTDEKVVSIEEGSKKSVIITAKEAGTTILTAVNGDNFVAAYCKITVLAPITEISLDEGETITVKLSQEAIKFHANYNSDATDVLLKWSSSNSAIAKVDETGFIELLSAGTTVITVMPEWNPYNVMAQCRLTVLQSATGFALDKSEITLEVGAKETLKAAVLPDKATTTITWKSLNSKVATVGSDGVVTAVAAGQAYVVANTENGFVDNCLVTVTQKASGVKLSDYNVTINVGESYTVTATPNPTTSTETKFTWTSKDPSIATVKDGTVTGVSAGSTIILVKTKSGDVAYLYVTVKDKAKGMELNYSTKSVAKGSSFTLKPIFTPTNTSNKNVTWTSSNTGVATVSEKGKVTGVKGGSAIITAVSEDGGYVATCLVTVVQPVSSVKLNHTSYKLGLGKSVTLKATVTSNTSSNPKVKWTSSNTKVATVSSTGKVTAKKLGSCTITAKVTDGTGKKATCKITVVREATSIKLNRSYLTLVTGKNYRLKATIKPTNATYKTVKWSSSDTAIARVDDSGLVRGLSVGSCNVEAAAKDNSKKSDFCYVEVIEPIPSTSVIVADKNMVMIRGESQMLSYSIVPSNSTDSVKFASGNKNIATVSSSGKVYARRAGATSITITTSSGKQTVIQLQVIGLNKTSLTLEQYDTETLYVDGATTGVSWYSANPSIATVVNGKVVGRKKGTTTIYAKVSGITLGCKVTVKNIS
ncbi:MAG: Ig-like domain-containing protein, partial [Acetivibrio ethanolgignens]